MLYVSAHLDDVVLSCAHRLRLDPSAAVVTVFTDAPPVERRDGWNHTTTGCDGAQEAQALRRAEDLAALTSLGAIASWLGCHEAEYCDGDQDVVAITERLRAHLSAVRAAVVAGPLGLRHSDHLAVSDAVLATASPGDGGVEVRLYLDQPYAESFPELVSARLGELSARGFTLTELEPVSGESASKLEAFAHYTSQVAAVRADHPGFERSLGAPERIWAVRIGGATAR